MKFMRKETHELHFITTEGKAKPEFSRQVRHSFSTHCGLAIHHCNLTLNEVVFSCECPLKHAIP